MMILEVGENRGNAHRPKNIGTVVDSLPPLPTALVDISFSAGGRPVAYNVRGPGIQFHPGHCIFGGKTCSTVTQL
jgi:hypothetical protein